MIGRDGGKNQNELVGGDEFGSEDAIIADHFCCTQTTNLEIAQLRAPITIPDREWELLDEMVDGRSVDDSDYKDYMPKRATMLVLRQVANHVPRNK